MTDAEILGLFVIIACTLAVVILYAALALSGEESRREEMTKWCRKEGGSDDGKEKISQVME